MYLHPLLEKVAVVHRVIQIDAAMRKRRKRILKKIEARKQAGK